MKKPVHYVNNKQLYEVMIEHRKKHLLALEEGRVPPVAPDYIGKAILLICNKLALKYNFINYSYRDDMVSEGLMNCVAAITKFDPAKSTNPFAYFTRIAWTSFVYRINREKKQAYIKAKNLYNSISVDSLMDFQEGGEDSYSGRHNMSMANDYGADIIEAFEKKQLTKPKKLSTVQVKGLEKFIS